MTTTASTLGRRALLAGTMAPAVLAAGPGLADGALLFSRTAIGTGAPKGSVYTFAQPFAKGRVPREGRVVCRVKNGAPLPTQCDPQTWWEDGTVKFALMAIEIPRIGRNETAEIEFHVGVNPEPMPAIDLARTLAGRSASITVEADAGRPWTVDLVASLPEYRRRAGPLVTETRVAVAIPAAHFNGVKSGRVVCCLWATRDGALYLTPWVGNDSMDWPDRDADAVACAMTVTVDGAMVLRKTGVLAPYAGGCRFLLGRRGAADVDANCIFLRPALDEIVAAGVCGIYDPTLNPAPSWRAVVSRRRAAPEWNDWTTGGTTKPLRFLINGGPGGGDQGLYRIPFDDAGAAWMSGGGPEYYLYAIERAEAMGAQAFYNHDRRAGRFVDGHSRPGWRLYDVVPNGPIDKTGTRRSFASDTAHFPQVLPFAVYMSGRQDLMDTLAAYTTMLAMSGYHSYHGIRIWTSTTDTQVRSLVYNLSQFLCANFSFPQNMPDIRNRWIEESINTSMDWLIDYHILGQLMKTQGEVSGALIHYQSGYTTWMQAVVVWSAALGVRQRVRRFDEFLAWMKNFMVGGWLQTVGTMPYSMIYHTSVPTRDPADRARYVDTWAQFARMVNLGPAAVAKQNVNYVRLARAQLVMYALVDPDDRDVRTACAAFSAIPWPGRTLQDLAAEPGQAIFAPPGYPYFRENDPARRPRRP